MALHWVLMMASPLEIAKGLSWARLSAQKPVRWPDLLMIDLKVAELAAVMDLP